MRFLSALLLALVLTGVPGCTFDACRDCTANVTVEAPCLVVQLGDGGVSLCPDGGDQ